MRRTQQAFVVCVLLCNAIVARAQELQKVPAVSAAPAAATSQKIVKEGVEIEFNIAPAINKPQAGLMEEEDALVRFRITDAASKTPMAGVRPMVWLSQREGTVTNSDACRTKIQSYLQGSLRARPEVDLNSYYILTLNQEPSISVIDPLLGFGGSKLVTLTRLTSPGEDWVITKDQRRLFVSMPAVDKVAIIDTSTWKVVSNVDTGSKPTRVSLQPDEKYLWVATENGVTIIDTTTTQVRGHVTTGPGPHDLAVNNDNTFAYLTNSTDGTLSAIDIRKLAKASEIKIGASASAVSFSPLSKALYVSDEATGQVVVVDRLARRVLARMVVKPGVGRVHFTPDGRYGFAPNPLAAVVYILDAATNQLLHTVAVGQQPDQIGFTSEFAYVRSAKAVEVTMLRLRTIGKELDIVKFPGGQRPPGDSSTRVSRAAAIVPAPEGNSVVIANTADRQIYYYTEGMAAPMGSFQNYRRDPRAVLITDRSLREITSGVYETVTRMKGAGTYDVAFLLDTPRITHCFEAQAAANPTLKRGSALSLRIEYLNDKKQLTVGEDYVLRFRITDAATNKPKDGLKDVHVLTFLAPGTWQKREFARGVGEGIYELRINLPETGVYLVFVESRSQGVTFRQLPHLTLHAAQGGGS